MKTRSWLWHQCLHAGMAACLFIAGIIFKTLHDSHNPRKKLTL